jgi:hypothetical protein
MSDLSDDELLSELGVSTEAPKSGGRTPREERIIAGFEDILRFHEEHGRAPMHGEERDIFERLYAVRLDRLREKPECRDLLAPYDKYNLLDVSTTADGSDPETLDDDSLLVELGIAAASDDDITVLKHVTSREEKRAAEEIANRTPCEDFDRFKPLFSQVKQELDLGMRETREFQRTAEIKQGEFFIVGGQIAYVAELGDEFVTEYERKDRRLRVIYDNGTESNVLARSLQKALYRDGAGRRITNPAAGPLFDDIAEDDDLASGTIYVLRSKSEHPTVVAHRKLIHKIGVTGGKVETRIANAEIDATYLLAGVEVIATYNLFNIKRSKLENILHRVFARARLDLTIEDRFGNPVKPKEWFLVPLHVIDEVVDRIRDQSIIGYEYDPATASLKTT